MSQNKRNNNTNILDFSKLRNEKECIINQNAKAIWLTGLSGSGKTTLAIELEKELLKKGFVSQIIDGDDVRGKLNFDLGFTDDDRKENIRRIAEVTKLFLNCGIITINCFVSPTAEIRNIARQIIGLDDFIQIYVNSTLEVCECRDVKGLYKKARAGKIKDFTGIDAPFEPPVHAYMEIRTDMNSLTECTSQVMRGILPLIKK
jgi:adenylylsulfate kinase